MAKQLLLGCILILTLLFCCSCTSMNSSSLVPAELQGKIVTISLSQVQNDPHKYHGEYVVWGGAIINTVNTDNGTVLEILELPLDSQNQPKEVDTSSGRFMAHEDEFLDPFIYRQGRQVTVVGTIQGLQSKPLGKTHYEYPLIQADKVHLWDQELESIKVYHEFERFPVWYHRPFWWGYPYYW